MKKITLMIAMMISIVAFSQQQIYNLGFESGDADGVQGNWTTFENPAPGLEILANPIPNGVNNSATTQVLKLTMEQSSACYAGTINFHGILGTWELDGAVPSNLTLSMDVNKSVAGGGNVGIKFANVNDGTLFEITDAQGAVSTPGTWETLTWDISAGAASGENFNIDQVVVFIDFTCGNADRPSSVELLVDNIRWGANKLTDPPMPTCDDGVQNGDETGIDCGGPDCGACIEDPTAGPVNNGSTGTDFYIYSELSGNANSSDFAGFNLVDFAGGVTITQPNLNGDTVLRADNMDFFGSGFGELFDATATYTYVHLNYYATTSTQINFSLVDDSLSQTVCCGNPAEPFFKIGGGDAPLITGEWVSVFIPLSHYSDFNSDWDGTDLKQTLFTGNGTFFVDNIFFSTTNSLGTSEFEISEFSAYPNPTQNVWNIKTNNQNIDSIELLDIQGRQVLSLTPNANEAVIAASNLPAGLYFAKINAPLGSKSIKLIKQ